MSGEQQKSKAKKRTRPETAAHSQKSLSNRKVPEQNSSNKNVQPLASSSSAAPNSSKKRTRSASAKNRKSKRSKRTLGTTDKKTNSQEPAPAQSSSASGPPASTSAPAATSALDNDKIFISVVGENDHKLHFKLSHDTPMELLKTTYAQKLGLETRQASLLRFLFDGRRIADSDTPETLEMADDDIIEAFREQTGGAF